MISEIKPKLKIVSNYIQKKLKSIRSLELLIHVRGLMICSVFLDACASLGALRSNINEERHIRKA